TAPFHHAAAARPAAPPPLQRSRGRARPGERAGANRGAWAGDPSREKTARPAFPPRAAPPVRRPGSPLRTAAPIDHRGSTIRRNRGAGPRPAAGGTWHTPPPRG